MNKGCWKLDENDEAVFIDIDDEVKEEEENKIYSRWSELPNLLLEKIFSFLSIREKYYASLVCKSWNTSFYLPYVWSRFVLEDTTLTRGRFNYYTGWQYVLDHLRTQMCLSQVGRNFRNLTFDPMLNFYNLYEFMNMISWYVEQSKRINFEMRGVGCNIQALKFTFPCNMNSRDESERTRLFGTGGKLLEALKRLMRNLTKMKRLELIDLMLDSREAQHLLDEVCELCYLTLTHLALINTTRIQCQLLHIGVFLNLQVLTISPQNLGEDAVELLGCIKLRHLHIIQNRFTPNDSTIQAVPAGVWKACKKNNPALSVYLQVEGTREKEVVWQPMAPVKAILYDSSHMKLQSNSMLMAIDMYKNYLQIYGHKELPRFHMPKSFHERIDSLLLLLCRQCIFLRTLIIRERVSTSTLLLLAYTAKNLRYFYVRRNAVILRCDWPRNPEWSDEFYTWLKVNSRSYDLTEMEVSQVLGFNWKMLSDREFRFISVDMHANY
ncbi:uncharacterized protein CBL_00314 [Carabus blaptoides fortunei]